MDKLQKCAKAFENLLEIQYRIIIGRKGKTEFVEKAFFTTTAAPFGDNILRVVNSYLDKEGISGLTTDPSPEVDDKKELHFVTTRI